MSGGYISTDDYRKSLYYGGYNDGYDSQSDRATFHDLNGSQAYVVFSSLLEKFREQLEEAKLRCEDEDDETSLGEYISLKSVVEQMEKFFAQMIRNEYSRSSLDAYMKKSTGYKEYMRGLGY